MNIQLLLTGDELMAGDVVDSNSAYIAQVLKDLGQRISRKVTVGDDMSLLVDAIVSMTHSADVLIINGGLGPTVDDLTAQALATALNQPLELNEIAHNQLQEWAAGYKISLNAANLKQAYLPASSSVIANPVGSACGFHDQLNNCHIYCTPGVPRELFKMMEEQIIPSIKHRFDVNDYAKTVRLRSFGLGESSLQQLFTNELSDWPKSVELGFRAVDNLVEIKVSTNSKSLDAANQRCVDAIQALIPEHIYGTDDDTPASVLIDILRERKLHIATAESCTGGLIASELTRVAGASAVFETGYITYSNAAKTKLVNVPEQTLAAHGAVSEAVVKAMVAGALANSGADIAVSVSGIAGPDGGSPEKPVGTVWIGWGCADNIKAARYVLPRSRRAFQNITATIALDLLRRELLGLSTEHCHFRDFNFSR